MAGCSRPECTSGRGVKGGRSTTGAAGITYSKGVSDAEFRNYRPGHRADFVFAVTAALSSAVTELVARLLGLRGAYLLTGLRELVDGGNVSTDLAQAQTAYLEMRDIMRGAKGPSAAAIGDERAARRPDSGQPGDSRPDPQPETHDNAGRNQRPSAHDHGGSAGREPVESAQEPSPPTFLPGRSLRPSSIWWRLTGPGRRRWTSSRRTWTHYLARFLRLSHHCRPWSRRLVMTSASSVLRSSAGRHQPGRSRRDPGRGHTGAGARGIGRLDRAGLDRARHQAGRSQAVVADLDRRHADLAPAGRAAGMAGPEVPHHPVAGDHRHRHP